MMKFVLGLVCSCIFATFALACPPEGGQLLQPSVDPGIVQQEVDQGYLSQQTITYMSSLPIQQRIVFLSRFTPNYNHFINTYNPYFVNRARFGFNAFGFNTVRPGFGFNTVRPGFGFPSHGHVHFRGHGHIHH